MNPHDTTSWSHLHRFETGSEKTAERKTLLALALTACAMVAEITAGILYNSMALQADGWHMFTHVGALGIAAFAYSFARRNADNPDFAFGTGKVGALGGYSSALILLVVAVLVLVESAKHLLIPQIIDFDQALPIAGFGLCVNLLSAWVLGGEHDHGHGHNHGGHDHAGHDHGEYDHGGHDHHGAHDHHAGHAHHGHDLNLRAAYVHVLADAVTSVLAIGALLAGRFWGLWQVDPIMGLVGGAVIANWSISLIRGSGSILLDHSDETKLRDRLRKTVEAGGDSWLADLHLWSVSPKHRAAILSVVTHGDYDPAYYKQLLADIEGLSHVTVEVNVCPGGQACRLKE